MTEVYTYRGSNIIGSYVVFLLGVIIGYSTGWEKLMPVSMVPEGATMASMGYLNNLRGGVELKVIFNKRI